MEVLVLAAAAGATALAAWLADQRRARRRNRSGQCAACATPWSETPTEEPYLIHGRLVCEPCAAKAKRRIPWQLAAIGGFGAIASGSTVAGNGATAIALFAAAGTVAMTFGAVQLMKAANRRAQRSIAAGDFPDIDPLRPSREPGAELLDDPSA